MEHESSQGSHEDGREGHKQLVEISHKFMQKPERFSKMVVKRAAQRLYQLPN